jgi:DNA polymerase-3 subunit delta
VAVLKPAYLIHGDDHGAVAERRAGLRALAEREGGDAASVELLEGDAATPAGVAQALAAMVLSLGRRVIIVEGVERWREAEVERDLFPAMSEMPPETTLALFAREEARAKAPAAVHEAVKRAGGQVVAQMTVKPWELPRWAREQAGRMGLALDGAAAKALVAQVGERQQRLLRELEKLALGADEPDPADPAEPLDAAAVEQLTASSAERRVWTVADAVVAGDTRTAVTAYLQLRQQGERLPGLLYWISQRVRTAHEVAVGLDAGEPPAQVKRRLRMPSKAADRLIADARRAGSDRLAEAICEIADLELASRGGASGGAGEDTAALIAIGRLAA